MIFACILFGQLATCQASLEGEWAYIQENSRVGRPEKKESPKLKRTVGEGMAPNGFEFTKDQWKAFGYHHGKISHVGTFSTGKGKEFDTLDLTTKRLYITDKPKEDHFTNKCIYKVEGDVLTIVLSLPGNPRPESFHPADCEEVKYLLIKLKRKQ